MLKHRLKRYKWSYRTITIEIDDQTAKNPQAAAERAGLTIAKYLRQVVGIQNSPPKSLIGICSKRNSKNTALTIHRRWRPFRDPISTATMTDVFRQLLSRH